MRLINAIWAAVLAKWPATALAFACKRARDRGLRILPDDQHGQAIDLRGSGLDSQARAFQAAASAAGGALKEP